MVDKYCKRLSHDVALLLLVFAVFIGTAQSATVTKTITAVTTTTTTSVKNTYTICATLVNAASPCRKRRHLMEQPEIMAVNNDIAKYLGSIYGNPIAYDSPNQFQDSASIMDRELNTESPTADVIQSSMDQLPFRYYQREASSFVFQGLAPYFSFQSLASFYSSLLRLTTTVVTTSTSTVTATVTSLSTTATSRFTISGCSPASLFYSTC